ncbi:MAG: cell division protein SepF [Oscillospiraceae bacterium]|nr:cell division protein SepF [Oscillospiraceae bacterium]
MGLFDDLKRLTRPFDDDDDFIEDDAVSSKASNAGAVGQAGQIFSGRPFPADFATDYASEFEGRVSAPPPDTPKDNKVVNIHTTTQVQVVLVKPERFETAAEIADHLREKRTVVMNLEQTNKDVARRLIDFLSGVAYAQDGKIKKVAVSTYMITPYTVNIVGDLLDELESSGLRF